MKRWTPDRRLFAATFARRLEYVWGCWVFQGAKTHNGYGKLRVGASILRAHRLAYQLLQGPIPRGLEVDHLCRNRACIRPGHLALMTRSEHARKSNHQRWTDVKGPRA